MSLLLVCFFLVLFRTCVDGKRPNFVLILLNTQDIVLESPSFMPNLQELIIKQGITLSNAFTATSVDCPMRTETIVGRYFHNIGPPNGSCMGIDPISNIFSSDSIFSILHNHQYKTGVFGKLVNFRPDAQMFCDNKTLYHNITNGAGMDRVYSQCMTLDFYSTKYFDKYPNGTYQFTNLSYNNPSTYQGSQIGNASLKFIENMIIQNKSFFNYIGYHNPDINATVAPWYIDYYYQLKKQGIKAPRLPNFDVQTTGDMSWVNQQPKFNNYTLEFIDNMYIGRIASNMITDEYIGDLYKLLNKYNELNNTYIIYTSDNGYKLGNHRLPCECQFIYEEDIRVPFYIRGPNIRENSNTSYLISNVDILPTIMDIIGINISDKNQFDGKSFKEIIENPYNNNIKWREYLLSEIMTVYNKNWSLCETWFPDKDNNNNNFHGINIRPNDQQNTGLSNMTLRINYGYKVNPGNTWRGLRILNNTYDWTYGEFIDYNFSKKAKENPYLYILFDNKNDPYQLNNVYESLSNDIKSNLHQMLMKYGDCKGKDCP